MNLNVKHILIGKIFFVLYFGHKTTLFSTYLNVPREKMEIVSCMKGGMIENWDLFEEILDYTLKKVDNLKLKWRSMTHRLCALEFSELNLSLFNLAIAQRIRISSPSYVGTSLEYKRETRKINGTCF